MTDPTPVDRYLQATRLAAEARHLADEAFAETFGGMSPQQINAMSVAEFARLTGRPTPAEMVHAARSATETAAEPAADPSAPAPAPTAAPDPYAGLDPDSPEFFHAWRAQRTSGGEGVGIFSGISSQSAEYRAAAARHAGRTAYSQSNVVESPKIGRAFVNQDEHRDARSLADRFGTPGNAYRPGS